MEDADVSDLSDALRSYELPVSPCLSPTGSDGHMSVWLEESGGEHLVRIDSATPLSPVRSPRDHSPPASAGAVTVAPEASTGSLDFPLELCGSSDCVSENALTAIPSTSGAMSTAITTTTSAAIVPFQKLQMDTNLHQTTLPPRGASSPVARGGSVTFSSPLKGFDGEEHSMTQGFMDALRLGDLRPQEPQLSVRLRGSRVELASASEDEGVDFLGPAENIKKLFKLPYSQSRVSLAVHRVGGTLVVDGEINENDMPIGFEDSAKESDPKKLEQAAEEKSQQLLYEKFIFQSAVAGSLPNAEMNESALPVDDRERQVQPRSTPSTKHKSRKSAKKNKKLGSVPTASAFSTGAPGQQNVPGETTWGAKKTTESSHEPDRTYTSPSVELPAFQRVLKWKFHDLKMILGSEVLLFSNAEHPAVSLRLHDVDKELSLCTVLDYYLDNVIANIPELAICMHSKGFVRGYKLVDTRQIPYISGNSQPLFDIHEVSMNASMLLKFLKENCTRANGTYWLHRKEGETSLRLYDVNVLSQGKQLKWKYMMAMLCYRFATRASRMMYSLTAETPSLQRQLQHRQRDLLRTCMTLLKEIAAAGGSSHNSICSSVSEQLADSYLRECSESVTTSSSSTASRQDTIDALKQARSCLEESIESFRKCMATSDDRAALPNDQDSDNGHVSTDSTTIEDLDEDSGGVDDFMAEELARLELKCSSVSIHLSHVHLAEGNWSSALHHLTDACALLELPRSGDFQRPASLMDACNNALGADIINQLLDKLDFDGIARQSAADSLDKILPSGICSSVEELRSSILELLGDAANKCTHSAATRGLKYVYDAVTGEGEISLATLREMLETVFGDEDESRVGKETDGDGAVLLQLAFCSYVRALTPPVDSERFFRLMKKLGNACNELGKYYLSREPNHSTAFSWFERGCRVFKDIEDGVNVALLYANLAHLHKILAQGQDEDTQFSHYSSAVQRCEDAIALLKQNRVEDELHRKVEGELALTYLVWGVSASGRALGSRNGGERKKLESEVLKLFGKALALYTEISDAKQVASTHYQIASFHARTIARDVVESQTKKSGSSDKGSLKSRMEISRRHYDKALDFFAKKEVGRTFILIHQDLADMYALGGRFEDVEHALLLLLNTYEALRNLERTVQAREMKTLGIDVIAKLQATLPVLIRLATGGTKHSGSVVKHRAPHLGTKDMIDVYKRMYREVIYFDSTSSSVADMLQALRSMYLL
ncbi:hypothetical protein PINS_up000630 [Pythium insidiosum]|nr:hypothetical protein PINS_up000630 [Pythium insidiosum]